MDGRKPILLVPYDLGTASPSAILEAAGDLAQVVFVFDSAAAHPRAMSRVLKALALSFDVSPGYSTQLSELEALRPQGIATFSESCLGLAARLGHDLGLRFHTPATVDRLTDKSLQRTILNSAGLSRVRSMTIRSVADLRGAVATVGTPFIVKPLVGFASRHTVGDQLAADLANIEETLGRQGDTGPWVVEEMIPAGAHPTGSWLADYVSVESAVADDEVWHFAVTDKLPLARPFRETGAIMPSSLELQTRRRVLEVASSAIKTVGVRSGLVHTEIRLAAGGPQVIEVNGRLGGEVATLIRRSCGFDPVRLAIQLALGHAMPAVELVHDRIAVHYAVLAPQGRFELVTSPDPSVFIDSGKGVSRVDIGHRKGAIVDSSQGTLDAIARIYADASEYGEAQAMIVTFDRIARQYVELRRIP